MTDFFSSFVSALQANPNVFVFACGFLGLSIGSFLNVVIYRMPVMMQNSWRQECTVFLHPEQEEALAEEAQKAEKFNLAFPRSRCPKCNHQIKSWENIPVISWLILLRGKCSQCKTKISMRYPFIELTTGILFAVSAAHFGVTGAAVAACLFTATLIVLTMIDFDHMLLPDNLVLPLLWAGLILNYYGTFTSFESAFWGAIAGYMVLWTLFWIFKIVTGKDGMGYGDFKLLAALGAWCGWEVLPAIIVLSSVAGVIVGGALILSKKLGDGKPMPFGPYLAIAGWVALLWGAQISDAWLRQHAAF